MAAVTSTRTGYSACARCALYPETLPASARLRAALTQAGAIAGTDAVVATLATTYPDAIVLTSDPRDLTALLADEVVEVVRV